MGKEMIPVELIAHTILVLRRPTVLLDVDLARLYGVATKVLNQAVKRNAARFPEDFMFRLTADEAERLIFQSGISSRRPDHRAARSRSHVVTLKRGQNIKHKPDAFTEQGVAMLSSVLRSERAVKVNIGIMCEFVPLREALETNRAFAQNVPIRGAHATRVLAMASRHRELFPRRPAKFVSASRRNQHASRVRSPRR